MLGALVVAYFIAGFAYLGLRHYLWPRLNDWRPLVVAELSTLVGRPVQVGRIDTGFEGFFPRLTIHDLRIDDGSDTPALVVPRAVAVVAPDSLFSGGLRLSVLQFDGPSLRIERFARDRLRVAGMALDLREGETSNGAVVASLLAQRRILLNGATVEWIDHESGRRTVVRSIDLALGSVGRRHRASLSLAAGTAGVSELRLAFEIFRSPGLAALDWRGWTGQAYVAGTGLDLDAVRGFLPQRLSEPLGEPLGGQGDLKLWVGFERGKLIDAQARLAAQQLRWGESGSGFALAGLRADVAARGQRDGYQLTVQRLDADLRDELTVATTGPQQLSVDAAGRVVGGRIAMAPFDAGRVLDYLRGLPLEAAFADRLRSVSVSGGISALSAQWNEQAGLEFEAALDFERLSLRYSPSSTAAPIAPTGAPGRSTPSTRSRTEPTVASFPWFENLSGEARVRRHGGELRVRTDGGTLGFPGVFAQPAIALDSVRADASWKMLSGEDADQVAVEIAELRFANQDAAGVLTGSYRTGGKGAGIVDLTGRLERADATKVARYLPLQIDKSVRSWVAESILAGKSDDVRLKLRGDLEDFPFRDPASGEFQITADVRDSTLRYAPGWPHIDGVRGSLVFERAGMQISTSAGRVYGVTLGKVRAQLADFLRPALRIEGSGIGPAADMIRFVNESPVSTRIDDFTRDAAAVGDARLALRLELPLEDLDRSRVWGSVTFQGNELTLDNTVPGFSGVSGVLEFTDERLALRDLRANFLGGEIRVSGETPEPGRFELRAQGSATAAGMRTIVDNRLTRALGGAATYRASVDVRRRASTVRLESDLVGLSSALPAPLRKAADDKLALKVETRPQMPGDPSARPGSDELRVALGDAIRLRFRRERDPRSEKLLIRSGVVALNAEPVLGDSGLAVVLSTDKVDVDSWLPLLADADVADAGGPGGPGGPGDGARPGFAKGFSLEPNSVTLVATRVFVGGKELNDVVLGATRIGRIWNANVDSRQIDGFFAWRAATPGQPIGKLTARFNRLDIPRTQVRELEYLLEATPTELPALDVVAERFHLYEHSLGRLELQATNSTQPTQPGWRLDRLRITNPAATFLATGNWAPGAVAGVRPTRLQFTLDLVDAGEILAAFGLTGVMRGGSGKLSGGLHWIGSPLSIDYPSLGGHMKVEVGKGQFLKTDPGIAKLIGVLNLQSLPRRLKLDFQDVFVKGFSFDSIRGDVAIGYGVARTSDLTMRGVQAQVKIRGEADIQHETQALSVEVVPELNAGLASLAYGAMVNPAIGLGAFVAQLALQGQLQQFFRYEYDVNGSWTDPQVVERRRAVETAPATMP